MRHPNYCKTHLLQEEMKLVPSFTGCKSEIETLWYMMHNVYFFRVQFKQQQISFLSVKICLAASDELTL